MEGEKELTLSHRVKFLIKAGSRAGFFITKFRGQAPSQRFID